MEPQLKFIYSQRFNKLNSPFDESKILIRCDTTISFILVMCKQVFKRTTVCIRYNSIPIR